MNCEDARRHLWAYLDQELDPGMHSALTRHLDRCEGCLERFRGAQGVERVFARSLLAGSPTKSLWTRLERAIPDQVARPANPAAEPWLAGRGSARSVLASVGHGTAPGRGGEVGGVARLPGRRRVWGGLVGGAAVLALSLALWKWAGDHPARPQRTSETKFLFHLAKVHSRVMDGSLGKEFLVAGGRHNGMEDIHRWVENSPERSRGVSLPTGASHIDGLAFDGASSWNIEGAPALVVFAREDQDKEAKHPILVVVLAVQALDRGILGDLPSLDSTRPFSVDSLPLAARWLRRGAGEEHLVAAMGFVPPERLVQIVDELCEREAQASTPNPRED